MWRCFIVQVRSLSHVSGRKTKVARARELLGVSAEASETEIRNCFRQKALETHPDAVRGTVSKIKATEQFVHLTEAAALLLNKKNEEEEDERQEYRRQAKRPMDTEEAQSASSKKVTPAAMRRSFDFDLKAAIRKVKHGPAKMYIDKIDFFPAALEMEERNREAPRSQPLLRLVHGQEAIGYVHEISEQELHLELFNGLVKAEARRFPSPTADRIQVQRLHSTKNTASTLISPRHRGMTLFGFGGWKIHHLTNTQSGDLTHRLLEYFSPGVHAMLWHRYLGSPSIFFDPLLATTTRASFPLHKRWWPTFFQDFRPETHASDGMTSAYYLERHTSTSGVFIDRPRPHHIKQHFDHDPTLDSPLGTLLSPPSHANRPRKASSLFHDTLQPSSFYRKQHSKHVEDNENDDTDRNNCLDPTLCVFAAAFHSLDNIKYNKCIPQKNKDKPASFFASSLP